MLFVAFKRKDFLCDSFISFESLFTFGKLRMQYIGTLSSFFLCFLTSPPPPPHFFIKTLSGTLLNALIKHNSLLGFR